MSERSRRIGFLAILVATLVAVGVERASATLRFGPLLISGNAQSQNIVRTPDIEDFEYIQNRNVARLRIDYDWLEGGRFLDKYDIPFIQNSHITILWRGVYDSVYTLRPGFIEKEDIHGKAYGGDNVYQFARKRGFSRNVLTLDGLTNKQREILQFDNQLREAFIDVKLRGIPLTLRAGRQQIVWGETDNFRMLDRPNALDLTWHFQQELPGPALGWDEIRRPAWMLKFLYDLGDIWKLSQNFLEWYWNPGDWYPAKQTFLPRPWGLRFLNPLTNPVDGVFIGGVCSIARQKVNGGPNDGLGMCNSLLNNTRLFQQGDYNRNAFENSQVGVRYHAITPQGFEFTLNYFYQRFAGDDGTNYAPLKGLDNTPANRQIANRLLQRGIFPAEQYSPYVHTVGMSGNYSDETYTQAILRFETILDFGVPFFDIAKETVIQPVPALPGITKKNMWKGMVGFDRQTWIRALNKKTTFFFTGQLFWHYLMDRPDCEPQTVGALTSEGKARVGSCLVGGLDLPSTQRTGSPESPANRDKVRTWESLVTFAFFTFYRGGSVVPTLGFAVDPVNQFGMEPFWAIDWVVRQDLILNLAQRYFVTPKGHSTPIFETWGLAGLQSGRSETSLRLTYQF